MSDGEPAWTLAATCRCLTEDLFLAAADCERPITELTDRHQVIDAFIKKRTESPVGVETIQSLARKKVTAYSLHSGRYRAATWHHEMPGIVWLLAAHWHEEGSRDDAYPYFESLLDAGLLLPTRQDVERVVDSRRLSFERALIEQVSDLRHEAMSEPGVIREVVIGGRIRIRVVYENGDNGLLFVAIGNRLIPGEMVVPPEWSIQVLAAFFPGLPLAEVEYTDEFAGVPGRPDEDCYCGLVGTL